MNSYCMEWRPMPRAYRTRGFDLAVFAQGRDRAVDGRALINAGVLRRFEYEVISIIGYKPCWRDLNLLIAKAWREQGSLGAGTFKLTLQMASRPMKLVVVELKVALGSDLPFADRTLESLSVFEVTTRKQRGILASLLSLLGIRHAA